MKTRALKKGEISRILATFRGPRAERNKLLVILGVSTGFRVSELLQIRAGQVIKNGEVVADLHVEASAMKGGRRHRRIRLNRKAREALRAYIERLIGLGQWRSDGFLFPGPHGRQMTQEAAWNVVSRAAKRAGIHGPIGTHSLRKAFAEATYSFWLDRLSSGERCEPIREVKAALGHRSVATTEAYLTQDAGRASAAVDHNVMELFDE